MVSIRRDIIMFLAVVRLAGMEEILTSIKTEIRTETVAEGKTEGKAEGKAELLIKLATLKFGPLSLGTEQRIKTFSAAELDQMGVRLLNAKTLDEVLGFG